MERLLAELQASCDQVYAVARSDRAAVEAGTETRLPEGWAPIVLPLIGETLLEMMQLLVPWPALPPATPEDVYAGIEGARAGMVIAAHRLNHSVPGADVEALKAVQLGVEDITGVCTMLLVSVARLRQGADGAALDRCREDVLRLFAITLDACSAVVGRLMREGVERGRADPQMVKEAMRELKQGRQGLLWLSTGEWAVAPVPAVAETVEVLEPVAVQEPPAVEEPVDVEESAAADEADIAALEAAGAQASASTSSVGMIIVAKPHGPLELMPSGQRVRTAVDRAGVPFTAMSEFDFELFPGQAGWPHGHTRVKPLVRIESGWPVATFVGWELEELVWIKAGERGVIDGSLPHWCVYPRRRIGGLLVPRWLQPKARGSETRNAPTVPEDTLQLAELWPIARQRIAERGWVVTYPVDAPEEV